MQVEKALFLKAVSQWNDVNEGLFLKAKIRGSLSEKKVLLLLYFCRNEMQQHFSSVHFAREFLVWNEPNWSFPRKTQCKPGCFLTAIQRCIPFCWMKCLRWRKSWKSLLMHWGRKRALYILRWFFWPNFNQLWPLMEVLKTKNIRYENHAILKLILSVERIWIFAQSEYLRILKRVKNYAILAPKFKSAKLLI